MARRILVVEDEAPIREMVCFVLEQNGYQPLEAEDFDTALNRLAEPFPDLVLLDWMLPGGTGLQFIKHMKREAMTRDIPVMMLTARGEEEDRVRGLEVGADDYITKPFNPRELTIRARNLLSRTMNLASTGEERRLVESYRFNGWELDINSRSLISPQGDHYKLPRSEFRAMLHFCENPGKIQTRGELLKKMTGRELKPHDRTVDVTIRRIRKHFESTPDTPEIIATIHGEGYRFCGDLEE